MKKIYTKLFIGFLFVLGTVGANAQIPVTVSGTAVTVPALAPTYLSLANALTALNSITSYSTNGTIIFTCTAGGNETNASSTGLVIGSATLNPLLSATNTVLITKSGGTVTLNAGTGLAAAPSATPDCILKLTGADYITIDGLTFTDGNAATATVAMEVGLGLFKFSAGDGCNNNTIQNCTFNMQRISNGSGSGPMLDGSWAIEVLNSTAAAAITALTPTNGGTLATNGTNSGNKFYSNTINNGNAGIGFGGYAATVGVGPAPTATTFLGDLSNDVGGVALATGNTILNYGGGAAATNPAAGIRANNQWGINISYNTVNNNNGSGVNHVTTLRGIYAQAGLSANATINNNTITVQSGATTSGCTGIENQIGGTAASNTVTINTNTINLAYTTATTGVCNGILNGATAATVNINSNTITGVAATNLAGTGTHVMIETGSPTTVTASSNSITSISRSGASGSWRGIKMTSPTNITVSSNTIDGLSWTTAASTGSIDAIYSISSAVNVTASNNIIRNLSTPTTGTITGINEFGVSGLKTYQNNQIYNFSTTAGGAGGASMRGISESTGSTNTYSGNIIYSLNSTGTTGGVGGTIVGITFSSGTTNNVTNNAIYDLSSTSTNPTVTGINIGGGTTNNISNNLIGDLRATVSTGNVSISGITSASGTTNNIFHNTVNIASTTTSATTFGTSAIYFSSSAPVNNLRNNIFVNTSTPGPTGGFTAAIRYTIAPTSTNFPAANNNNFYYAGVAAANKVLYCEGSTAAPANGQQTITAYKTYINTTLPVPGRENASVSEIPNFVSTTGSNPITTFLKYNTGIATQIEQGGGTGTGIATDYAGTTRCPGGGCPGGATTPDMGAWELNGIPSDLTAPSISAITLVGNACNLTSRNVTALISDASGVNNAGFQPKIYFRKNGGAYSSAAGTLTAGTVNSGTWTFTITYATVGGVVVTDVIDYFIVAQDVATPFNVGGNPSGGLVLTDVNTVTTPPTVPLTYTINNSIGGSYNVGAGQTYTTLTAAIAAYNTSCLTSAVTFLLTDAVYTEAAALTINANADASAVNTLTIKPTLANTTVAVTGGSATAIFIFNGADYVTINGSISATANTICPASVASRDLTITNTNAGTSSAVVWLQTTAGADAATNNKVINCNLAGSGVTQTLFGAGSGSATIGTASLGTVNNNNSFVNNNISAVQYGIYSQGASSANKNQGTVINQNLINTSASTKGGIWVGFENNITISANNVSNIAQTSSPDVFGITLGMGTSVSATTSTGNEVTNATVTKNIIGSVVNTGTFSAVGIAVASATSGTTLLANNMISGVAANGTSGDFASGIIIGGGTGSTTNVYYNTVSMQGTITGATAASQTSACLAVTNSTAPTLDLRNNIFSNTQLGNTGATLRFASIALAYSTFATLTSDYNDLYCAGAGPGTYQIGITGTVVAGTNSTTLANWQTTTGKDANSKNVLPVFISATDLHLNTTSNPLLDATATPVSVTDDIDCDIRNAVTPDIGADEFTPAVITDAGVTAIVLPNPFCPGVNMVSATVKNFGSTTITSVLIDWSVTPPGGAQPQVNPGVISIAPGASQTFALGNFTFIVGTTYSITAFTSAPNGGADGVPGNDSYTNASVKTGMLGTYTVGAAGTYTTLTAAIADYNTRSLCGAVVFELQDAAYAEAGAMTIAVNAAASAVNTLTIRPATTITASVSATVASGAILKILGSYVIIDGSNNATTSRNLTFTNASVTSPNVILIGSTGVVPVTNVTLKNSILINGVNTTTALVVSDGAAVGTAGYFSNITIDNNSIQKAFMGIYNIAVVAAANGTGLNITGNDLSTSGANAIRYVGIYVQGVDGATVQNNVIGNFDGISSEDDKGVWFATATVNSVINRNKIFNLNYTGTGGYGGQGVYISSGVSPSNVRVSNNMISNLSGDGWNYTSIPLDNTIGICVTGTQTGINIYYNSINLYGNTLNQTSAMSMGMYLGAGSVADIRDNIIVNNLGLLGATGYGTAGVYAVTNNAQFATINYNDYYVNPSGTGVKYIGQIAATGSATLATWQTATAQDANSLNIAPNFTSATDLHLVAATNCALDGYGTPIAAVTIDYDNATRDAGAPDMGADEFATTPAPSTMTTASNCDTKNVSPLGTLYVDGSCNLIAKVLPSGGSAVTGKIKTCTTLDGTQQTFNAQPYVQRHYDIEPSTSPATATGTITLYFTDLEFANYNTNNPAWPRLPTQASGGNASIYLGNVKVTQFHGVGSTNPTSPGNYPGSTVLITPVTKNYNGTFWELTFTVTGFSGFYVHTNNFNAPLPIIVNYLTGRRQGSNHLLNWKVTCTTSPRATMTLERSADSRNYTGINTITADAARCQQPFDYTDANPLKGMNYYRLKIVDADGKVTYSTTVALLNAVKGFDIVSIAPNPVVADNFKLNVASAQAGKMDIVIFDMQGRLVNRQSITLIAGFNSMPVNVANLPAGTYTMYGTIAEDKSRVIRFVKQ